MPTMIAIMKSGELDYYIPGVSEREMINEIDADVCLKTKCRRCGVIGLIYHPFHSPEGSYRAFQECPHCGETDEF